jgi:cyclic beta-1,2-glucan synthetase
MGTDGARAGVGVSKAHASFLLALLQALASLGLLALSSDPQQRIWQPPASARDLFALSPAGALAGAGIYLTASAWALARKRRLLLPLAALAIFAIPYAFNWLWILTSPELIAAIGRALVLGATPAPEAALFLGRTCVLAVFNAAVFIGIGFVKDGRFTRGVELYVLLLACAAFAAAAPRIADAAGSSGQLAAGSFGWRCLAVASAALAQAGLWVQTHLVTGALLDALRGRRPTRRAAYQHAGDGLLKGAAFGGCFMLLIQLAAWSLALAAPEAGLAQAPLVAVALAGGLLFPVLRTIVESFDGSAPFFRRFAANALDPVNLLRGLVVGVGLALAADWQLAQQGNAQRTGFGLLLGAAAYAGVDLACDAAAIAMGRRGRLRGWRSYALGALLGGAVGGALGWYFDATQLDVVFQKFRVYAGVAASEAGAGRYVIYPFFSKWGAIDLGPATGGVKLFFLESLSGVIGWSLAAPLFSVNLVLLTALLAKSIAPLRALFTAGGLVGVGEQALRVQRWGLWMAPVIYSFLRLSPEPTWYDQDGAVRSLVASLQALALDPGEFRRWSLDVFLGLLAYDWLRIVIWFDHMGLRVATLVNLSFVGGDALDEAAARFVGYRMRARVIPEGIRRFATWGPLLIPFYIPRGDDWNYAWAGAESLRAAQAPLSAPVASVLRGYLAAAIVLSLALAFVMLRERMRRRDARIAPARHPDLARAPASDFTLGNGTWSLALSRDGLGFSSVMSGAHGGREIDLTRRPDDPLSLRGKLFYLRDLTPGAAGGSRRWSLAAQPLRTAGADYAITQPSPSRLRIVNTFAGIGARAEIELAATEPAAHWRIELRNLEAHARRIEITSFQELALADADAERRHPQLSALYVATRFVAPLSAILAQDRRTHGARRPVGNRPIFYSAVRADPAAGVRLTGYEDSRARFIGSGSLREPRALLEGRARAPDDEGLLHTFDPCASLRVEVELAPGGVATLAFVDGWIEDEREAPLRIARQLGIAAPLAAALAPAFALTRTLDDSRTREWAASPFEFSPAGDELRIHAETPRPFSHVLASPLGHGALVNSDGAIFSFAGNSQKNALTPFTLDTVPAAAPGQAVYVVPLGSTQPQLVFPQPRGPREIRFGRGNASFRQTSGDLSAELEVCVVPEAPVELRSLRLENHGAQELRCRVAAYFEMVLAEVPLDSRGKLAVTSDAALGAQFFSNADNDFAAGVAFVATDLANAASECVRARFVGGGGRDLANPYFVEHGAADASAPDDGVRIAAFAGEVEVPAGGSTSVRLVLGQAPDLEQARQLVATELPRANASARATRDWWTQRLSLLRIESNLPELDRLVNDWLPYQVQTARLWARAGSEQRSGAYGFRDQLQDVLPLLFHDAALVRRQILLHAGQQFLEGDVLAWWHPSKDGRTGLGARTRASDVHLWLAYVVARYVSATGDRALLDVEVPFLEAPPLPRGADGRVVMPRLSRDSASVYEHCRRAIARTLARKGRRGLPLLGSGDWNDALDRAGAKGRGESVWLGFFLHDVLLAFAELADQRGSPGGGDADRAEAARLRTALAAMWRGERFVRATTDAGEELVFADALTSAWPVLSGAVGFEQGRAAVEHALSQLEREDLVLLLAPPFDAASRPDPGRIAEYPPGVRENGGQYTHGVSWLIDALVRLAQLAEGHGEEAARLRARAVELWIKISPLGELGGGKRHRYGVSPHQQPADVYFGPGYEGRGGWSWYTGGAARMLSAGYALLGIELREGELVVPADLFAPKGRLELKRLTFRGRTFEAPR